MSLPGDKTPPHLDLDLDLDLDVDTPVLDTFSNRRNGWQLVDIKLEDIHVGQDSPSPRPGLGLGPRAAATVC